MGQYFKPVILNDDGTINGWIHPHDYNNGYKLMEHSYITNKVTTRIEHELHENPKKIVWLGDYADDQDTYEKCNFSNSLPYLDCKSNNKYKFLCNWDKKEFVVLNFDKKFTIHPLPLLTAEGNGEGGGDYYGNDEKYVGTWARQKISLETEAPDGFREIKPDFVEN